MMIRVQKSLHPLDRIFDDIQNEAQIDNVSFDLLVIGREYRVPSGYFVP